MNLINSIGKDLLFECESFVTRQANGKLILDVKGATAAADLPPKRSYLTKAQIARRLGTSRRTLENWMSAKRNPIPFIRLGTRPRFVEEEVLRWAESGASCTARRARRRTAQQPDCISIL